VHALLPSLLHLGMAMPLRESKRIAGSPLLEKAGMLGRPHRNEKNSIEKILSKKNDCFRGARFRYLDSRAFIFLYPTSLLYMYTCMHICGEMNED